RILQYSADWTSRSVHPDRTGHPIDASDRDSNPGSSHSPPFQRLLLQRWFPLHLHRLWQHSLGRRREYRLAESLHRRVSSRGTELRSAWTSGLPLHSLVSATARNCWATAPFRTQCLSL